MRVHMVAKAAIAIHSHENAEAPAALGGVGAVVVAVGVGALLPGAGLLKNEAIGLSCNSVTYVTN